MKLGINERFAILEVLPPHATKDKMATVHDLRMACSRTIEEDGQKNRWFADQNGQVIVREERDVEIHIDGGIAAIIVAELKERDRTEMIFDRHLSLWAKFVDHEWTEPAPPSETEGETNA